MPTYPEIIFDAERMKYPHTGIYHYCKQLGDALLQQQTGRSASVGFYLPESVSGIFGRNTYQIIQNSLHKFWMPSAQNYKVWHCTYQGTNYFPWRSKEKIAITIHDLNFLYEKKSAVKQQKYLEILQKKISRSDAIIAISQFVKKEIENNLAHDNKAIQVIYNGCNISDKIVAVKPVYTIDFPYIFSIGAITPKKNFHILPASIVGNDLHLVIAGVTQDHEYMNKIFEQARKLGVEKRVHYIGPVTEPEKYWLMQNCSLFAFPSLAEGFGLPVIEAMRFGKPVLLSNATSLSEIGGDVACYLENFETEYVSYMANYTLGNFSKNAEKNTIDRSYQFSWQKSANQYWDIYEKLWTGQT